MQIRSHDVLCGVTLHIFVVSGEVTTLAHASKVILLFGYSMGAMCMAMCLYA